MAYKSIPLIDRFMRHVSPEPNTGCWLWTGAVQGGGYGVFDIDERTGLAHRAAYRIFKGPIREGLQIDHLCRVRCCVNPDHLEPVTHAENLRRGLGNRAATTEAAKQRSARTHCPRGHERNESNVYVNPTHGRKACRACNREKAREKAKSQQCAHAPSS